MNQMCIKMGIINEMREENKVEEGEDTYFYEVLNTDIKKYWIVEMYAFDKLQTIGLNKKFTELDKHEKSFVVPNWYALRLGLI